MIRLKGGIASKDHHWVDMLGRNKVQEFLNGFDVLEVLAKWILKAELLFLDHLSPLFRILIPEDPATVMLGLNDEYTELRYKDVIDLGGAFF